ncbi:MAG: hypothetical protein ABFR53_06625 [Actinomycetota bacterium]
MTRSAAWVLIGLLAIGSAVGLLLGYAEASTAMYAAGGLLVVTVIAPRIAADADRSWLPSVVIVAYLVKLIASTARWGVLEFVYGGSGDATGYHGAGNILVAVWRGFEVPEMAIGTTFVDATTAFLYVPHVPTFLGGFFLFATIAFLGQLLLYAAFRQGDRSGRLGWYAAGVFFLPTIVYWPSSIGKESLMFLFLGLASYGAAGLLKDHRLRWLTIFSVGVAGAAAVRPHVALILVSSLAVAIIFRKRAKGEKFSIKRLVAIAATGSVLVAATVVAAMNFGIDFSSGISTTDGIERVIGNVEKNTSGGGSGVEGGIISSPAEFPAGFVKVLFRPFPTEAGTPQVMASSMEGMLLLGLLLWRLIPILKNLRHIRSHPYVLYAFVFTIGFVIAFSSFNNIGLLARQRSQVMPFLLVVVITLGWSLPADTDESPAVAKSPPAPAVRS